MKKNKDIVSSYRDSGTWKCSACQEVLKIFNNLPVEHTLIVCVQSLQNRLLRLELQNVRMR